MTTKGSLNKQVIITMSSNNSEKMIVKANAYVSNLNRFLKRVKSEYSVDFIYTDNKRLLITINNVVVTSNLNIIKKYIKDLNDIDYNDIESSRLSQFKSYFKILSISYFVEDTNLPILSDTIEGILKSTHIFNNITLISYSCIIKALPKSNMAIIWVDIWDSQSGSNAKYQNVDQ